MKRRTCRTLLIGAVVLFFLNLNTGSAQNNLAERVAALQQEVRDLKVIVAELKTTVQALATQGGGGGTLGGAWTMIPGGETLPGAVLMPGGAADFLPKDYLVVPMPEEYLQQLREQLQTDPTP